ncbi:hypothetical protein DL766_007586 [Monosporascus sp. MC13-8B]|uniref:CCD97-like C-terminal domain-containing protein n=1 Tax=Monosporascus cannonballus TaxID=155416 RepID=A0ABY0HIZ0_9PEZI|nr:hypothetical protein DL763_008205 [Monosporascus cannonballus]RYO94561.1 hypothetical protein DL762_000453 [Monosporascus cannonballus]RYP22993.1 hypothetical protein DL766_007586 [Monosporascus sp. MC13-8B]
MKTAQLTTSTLEWEAGPPNSLFPEGRRPRKNRKRRVRKGREAKLKAATEASTTLEASSDERVWFYDQPFEDDEACFNRELREGGEARPGDERLEEDEPWLDDKSLEEDEVCFDDDPFETDEAAAQTQCGDA